MTRSRVFMYVCVCCARWSKHNSMLLALLKSFQINIYIYSYVFIKTQKNDYNNNKYNNNDGDDNDDDGDHS